MLSKCKWWYTVVPQEVEVSQVMTYICLIWETVKRWPSGWSFQLLEAHLVVDTVTPLFLASLISLCLVEILDKSLLMMYGVSASKEHLSVGTNLIAERNNQLQESTIHRHYVKLEVPQVWWSVSEAGLRTKVLWLILGAWGDTEMVDGTGWRPLIRLTPLQPPDINTQLSFWDHWWSSLEVELTLLVKMYRWKCMILNHQNGTNLMRFKGSDTLVGRLMAVSTYTVVLNMRCQISQ